MYYKFFFNNFIIGRNFINHNKKIFYKENYIQNKDNQILIEFNNFQSNHIGISYLANILKKNYKAKIIAYYGHVLLTYPLKRNVFFYIKYFTAQFFNLNFFGIYKSFGTDKFIYPSISQDSINQLNLIYKNFYRNTKTLKKVLKFKINNVLVGDLMYDTYLKKNYNLKPTIDLASEHFQQFVKDFISLFLYWDNYIKNHKVKAIIGSHSVYSLSVPLRIALKYKIGAFILSPEYLRRIKNNFLYQHYEVHFLKKIFKKLKTNKKKKIIKLAKIRIKERTKGLYSSDYPYVTKSPFGEIIEKRVIKKESKIKVLIATHDFVDGPHSMGEHLFPDFYNWFLYLCRISKKTNYSWYVKTHPNFGSDWSKYIKYERKVVTDVLKDFSNINLLPSNITHNQIAKEGIDVVLTVHGTVALDYALLNIPTINASLNNPHINYNFTYHPKSITELTKMILNIKKITKFKKIEKSEIIEYYAMKNIFFSKNWLFHDYEKTIRDLGSYHDFWKHKMYNYWIENFELNKHSKINKDLENFVNSNNIYLLNNNDVGKF